MQQSHAANLALERNMGDGSSIDQSFRINQDSILGDPSKAKEKLGWTPRTTFAELVAEMVREDLKSAERDELIKKHGFKAMNHHE